MSRELTKKQKEFADDYMKTGNGRKSAGKVYDVKNKETARVIASENLTKHNIVKYLQDNARMASDSVIELAEGCNNPAVRLNASKDILDRAGFKPVEKVATLHVRIDGFKYIDPNNPTTEPKP